MVEPALVPEIYEGPRYERIGEAEDEPRFPDPYMQIYLDMVADMEVEMSVIPGMGALARILIRMVARDRIAALMSDRQDSIAVQIRCGSCGSHVFNPLWPENNARLLRSASELLKQARSADLDHALRTEFVLGLVTEVATVIDDVVEDQELRKILKESMRSSFLAYMRTANQKRIGVKR